MLSAEPVGRWVGQKCRTSQKSVGRSGGNAGILTRLRTCMDSAGIGGIGYAPTNMPQIMITTPCDSFDPHQSSTHAKWLLKPCVPDMRSLLPWSAVHRKRRVRDGGSELELELELVVWSLWDGVLGEQAIQVPCRVHS